MNENKTVLYDDRIYLDTMLEDDDYDPEWDREADFQAMTNCLEELPYGDYIIFGTIRRWDGPHSAYQIVRGTPADAVKECTRGETDASHCFYVKDSDLWWESLGHDNPVNPTVMRIRVLPDDYDEDEFFNKDICQYSEPIGDAVEAAFDGYFE